MSTRVQAAVPKTVIQPGLTESAFHRGCWMRRKKCRILLFGQRRAMRAIRIGSDMSGAPKIEGISCLRPFKRALR